jgi:hypothetical protein
VNEVLKRVNTDPDGFESMAKIVENAVDRRYYRNAESNLQRDVDHLNYCLRDDGYGLRPVAGRHQFQTAGESLPMRRQLEEHIDRLDLRSVEQDIERAVGQAEADPEGSLTSACSTLESVCKCILDRLGVDYPAKKDVGNLVKAVQNELNLSPDRDDIPPDIKRILGGLGNIASGIGSLRTHAGDAHGRGETTYSVDSRVARLSIHAASTVAVFFIETWQKHHSE